MRFEDLEVPERKIVPENESDVVLLRMALSLTTKNLATSSDIGPRVGRAMDARMSSYALLGMRRMALEEAIRTGAYYDDPKAVPVLSDKMTDEDLDKIVDLADERNIALTGGPE